MKRRRRKHQHNERIAPARNATDSVKVAEETTATLGTDENFTAGNKEYAELKSLVAWKLTEDKQPFSRDREMFVGVLGGSMIVIAVILGFYVFALFVLLVAGFLIYRGRQKPEILSFNLTDGGIFLGEDFVLLEKIRGYNIIDDPGERARLIVDLQRYIDLKEVVPIYDVDIARIEKAFESIKVRKNEELRLSTLTRLASFF